MQNILTEERTCEFCGGWLYYEDEVGLKCIMCRRPINWGKVFVPYTKNEPFHKKRIRR